MHAKPSPLMLGALALAAGVLTLPALAAAELAPGDHALALRHGGLERTYRVHLPPQAIQRRALPLVLSFHGAGGSAERQQNRTGLDRVADREGFIVVYPDGTVRSSAPGARPRRTFNAGGGAADQRDDVGFTLAILGELARQTPVDQTRVYATGMSNGGMMAFRLAAEASERIAAIAPVAGSMVTPRVPSSPVPVLAIHSVDNHNVPYAGGWGRNGHVQHPPVARTLERWVKWNGCGTVPTAGPSVRVAGRQGEQTATRFRWSQGCAAEVIHWRLTGVGHVWPGAPVLDTATEVWSFLRRFSRPAAPPLISPARS